MFNIYEIKKNPEGLQFDQTLDLAAELSARNPEILAIKNIQATGTVRYEADLFFLEYLLTYDITLASSRSMEPVDLHEELPVNELFVASESAAQDQDLVDADLVLIVEDDTIKLSESVADNILLNIPLKVLTEEEVLADTMPQGQDWQVLSQADYEKQQQEEKAANNPFAQLEGLFDAE